MRLRHATALIAATLLTLSLPHGAAAQTPSATPTYVPHSVVIRFDCDKVPWSCGDGPRDIRWQLYELTSCDGSGIEGCRVVRVGPIHPGDVLTMAPGRNFKLFLGPNTDHSDRAQRTCGVLLSPNMVYLAFHSACALNGPACAGPENWQLYADTGAGLVHKHKHITDCSLARLWQGEATNWVLAWGLPGELAASPTSTATTTMTALPPTETLTPTAVPPTDPPTVTATMAPSPSATAEPATATGGATGTASPAGGGLLLPLLGS